MIQGLVRMISLAQRQVSKEFKLRENFFNFSTYNSSYGNGMDEILYGMLGQNAQTMDRFITQDLTNFLLPEHGHDFGMDLMARNIQRGRDHGLPGYNDFREFCGMPRACDWSEAPQEITRERWIALSELYEHPNDIDLFVAGLAEIPVPDGATGRTFNCIKARQFAALKWGDRFFFSHSGQRGSLNFAQHKKILARTLGDIICDNTDIPETNVNAFLTTADDNPSVAGEGREPLDLKVFTR